MLNFLTFLKTQPVHNPGNSLRHEQSHEVVFKRDVKLRRSRISLTTRTTAQLPVYTTRFVALRTDNCKSSGCTGFRSKFDIRSPSRHVGRNCHSSGFAGFSNNFSFTLVLLGVKYLVLNLPELE